MDIWFCSAPSRKERTREIGAKTKTMQTKSSGPPRGDIGSEIFSYLKVTVVVRHIG